MTMFTARALSTNRLQFVITQTSHGFIVGNIVINDAQAGPPNYILAQANSLNDCQGCMMVSFIIDANNFVATQIGYVSVITSQTFTAGVQYFLNPSASPQLISTAPSTVGNVLLPCFTADTTTSGFFFGGYGTLIQSGSVFSWQTAGIDTNMGSNQGWFTSSGGTLNMTLPSTAAIGDVVKLSNLAGNFSLKPNTSSTINFGDDLVSNFITSGHVGDYIEVVCYVATPHPLWQTTFSIGNLIYS